MQNFRSYLRKDVANAPQIWLPIECNLIFRYEFAACSLQTRYIFVAILLYCGQRGIEEIPDDKRFLASALNADARTIEKAVEEMEKFGLLTERKKEREIRKEQTDRKEDASRVSVDGENLSQHGEENAPEKQADKKTDSKAHHSQFSLDECLKYVELCRTKGDPINNARALARNLFKTGEADSFIRAALYPELQKEADLQIYGELRRFSDEPCAVCFGAKMADTDGKGFRLCEHCRNEKGKSTGYEPEKI